MRIDPGKQFCFFLFLSFKQQTFRMATMTFINTVDSLRVEYFTGNIVIDKVAFEGVLLKLYLTWRIAYYVDIDAHTHPKIDLIWFDFE